MIKHLISLLRGTAKPLSQKHTLRPAESDGFNAHNRLKQPIDYAEMNRRAEALFKKTGSELVEWEILLQTDDANGKVSFARAVAQVVSLTPSEAPTNFFEMVVERIEKLGDDGLPTFLAEPVFVYAKFILFENTLTIPGLLLNPALIVFSSLSRLIEAHASSSLIPELAPIQMSLSAALKYAPGPVELDLNPSTAFHRKFKMEISRIDEGMSGR